MNFESVAVIDTNVILEDAAHLISISQEGKNLIVLPETVIDELDAKKSGFNEINYQAREFGRIISEADVLNTERVASGEDDITIMHMQIGSTLVDIISIKDYRLNNVDHTVLNDRKIIKVAKFATEHYGLKENTFLLSNDVMCRTRAISLDVKTQSLEKNKNSGDVQYVKILNNMNSSLFNTMEHKDIYDFDQSYKPENYCYHFKASDGNEKIGYIVNERINMIDDELFNGLAVKPINVGQKFAMAGMLDDRIDICGIEALAGSGKTLLSVAAGIKLIRQGRYDKIVYIRNSIESVDKAEEVGFLPGNDSKFIIYNYPLYDTLLYIFNKDATRKKNDEMDEKDELEKIRELQAQYKIETMWPGAIRGRTISNAYVIIDEVQNFSKKSLQTVMSRLDKDCKVVCIGSNRQIDNIYINKYTNGLSSLTKSLKTGDDELIMFGTELTKVVRGKITEWAERVFDK